MHMIPAMPPVIQSILQLVSDDFGIIILGSVSLPYSLWASSDLLRANCTLLSSGLITNNLFIWRYICSNATVLQSFDTVMYECKNICRAVFESSARRKPISGLSM